MNVVLIAHEAKKKLMQNFCIAYRGILSHHDVYATETTGRLVEEASGVPVHKFLAGHLGGVHTLHAQLLALGLVARDGDDLDGGVGVAHGVGAPGHEHAAVGARAQRPDKRPFRPRLSYDFVDIHSVALRGILV